MTAFDPQKRGFKLILTNLKKKNSEKKYFDTMHICEARIGHFVFFTGWLGGLSAQNFFLWISHIALCILYPPAFFIQVGWTALWLEKRTLTALSELDRAEHRSSWSVGPWKPASEQYMYWCKLAGKQDMFMELIKSRQTGHINGTYDV